MAEPAHPRRNPTNSIRRSNPQSALPQLYEFIRREGGWRSRGTVRLSCARRHDTFLVSRIGQSDAVPITRGSHRQDNDPTIRCALVPRCLNLLADCAHLCCYTTSRVDMRRDCTAEPPRRAMLNRAGIGEAFCFDRKEIPGFNLGERDMKSFVRHSRFSLGAYLDTLVDSP